MSRMSQHMAISSQLYPVFVLVLILQSVSQTFAFVNSCQHSVPIVPLARCGPFSQKGEWYKAQVDTYSSSLNIFEKRARSKISTSAMRNSDLVPSGKQKFLFIFGLGYVGVAVAEYMMKKGWRVAGTVSDPSLVPGLQELGIDAFPLFGSYSKRKDWFSALAAATHILSTVPPLKETNVGVAGNLSGSGKDPVLLAFSKELLEVAGRRNSKVKWLCYLSSTGVYGDYSGGWVREEDIPSPSTDKTKDRLNAEKAWLQLEQRGPIPPVVICRLAGIYGPGRSCLDTLLKCRGNMEDANPDNTSFTSRIHVLDIVRALEASMLHPPAKAKPDRGNPRALASPTLLNFADEEPATRFDVLACAAHLLGLPVFAPEEVDLNSQYDRWLDGARDPEKFSGGSRSGGSKKVDGTIMQDFLRACTADGGGLKHKDYYSGLHSIYNGDLSPFSPGGFELVCPGKELDYKSAGEALAEERRAKREKALAKLEARQAKEDLAERYYKDKQNFSKRTAEDEDYWSSSDYRKEGRGGSKECYGGSQRKYR